MLYTLCTIFTWKCYVSGVNPEHQWIHHRKTAADRFLYAGCNLQGIPKLRNHQLGLGACLFTINLLYHHLSVHLCLYLKSLSIKFFIIQYYLYYHYPLFFHLSQTIKFSIIQYFLYPSSVLILPYIFYLHPNLSVYNNRFIVKLWTTPCWILYIHIIIVNCTVNS